MFKILIICCFTSYILAANLTVEPVFQTGHYSKINTIQFHPDNQHLISCGDDGRLIIWDIQLGLQRKSVLAYNEGIKTFHFLNDTTIITLSTNSVLKTWRFPSLQLVNKLPSIKGNPRIETFVPLNDSTLCLAGKGIYTYNINSHFFSQLNCLSKGIFSTLDYQKQRNEIAVAGPSDNYCTVISLDTPFQYSQYILGNINTVNFIDTNTLLIANEAGTLQAIDLNNESKNTFHLHDDLNYITAMDLKNGEIAASTAFGFSPIFDHKTYEKIKTIGLNGIALTSLKYSIDGKWLATSNTNGTICLYETEQYKLHKILKGAAASITDLKLFGDDIFVGYSDGIIRHVHLPSTKIKSNSIKIALTEESNGVNYAILSIDNYANNTLEFTVLKTDRHHKKTSLLKSAEKIKSTWNLNENTLYLKKKTDDIALKIAVDKRFKQRTPFQIEQYVDTFDFYGVQTIRYETNPENPLSFYKISAQDTLFYPAKHTAPISGLRFSKIYQMVLSFSRDGSIRFWDKKGNYLAALYLSGQYGFTYWNPDNFYFSSKELLDKIGFIYNNKLFSYEQYDLFYNRPNEVMHLLPYFESKEVLDYKDAYHKRLEKLGITENKLNISETLPLIDVNYIDNYNTKKERVNFELTLTDQTHNITSFSYRINGIEQKISIPSPNKEINTAITVQLAAGINQIEFFCQNTVGVRSLVKKKNITCEKQFKKPDLYVVSIGMSHYADQKQDLSYAEKDASEIATLFSKSKNYNHIHQRTFLNADFTKSCLNPLKTFLNRATINDVIVFFYAGHGVLNEDLDYYLATYDMDFKTPSEKGIAFDPIEALFEALPCRNKLILIDACFSGEIDKSAVKQKNDTTENSSNIQFRSDANTALDGGGEMGIFELSKMTFIDLNQLRSTNILSSASGIEYAFEGEKWGNGLFTYVLKKGLKERAADLNGDQQIRIMELQVYLRETVSQLSNGKQNPILRKENIKNNFVIW